MQVQPINNKLLTSRAADVLHYYISDVSTDLQGKESAKTYISNLKPFASYLAANNVQVSEIEKSDIIRYREYLQTKANERTGKPLSHITINNYLNAIKMFFAWMESETKGQFYNVAKNVKSLKTEKEYTKLPLTLDQIKAVYKYLKDQIQTTTGRNKETALRNMALFDLGLKTGLRTMSLASLKIGDLAAANGRQIAYYKQKGKAEKAVAILEPMTVKRIKEYLATRKNVSDNDFLFCSHSNKTYGEGLTTKTIRYELRKIYDGCGLLDSLSDIAAGEKIKNKITAHSLRHTFGSMIAKEKGIAAAQIELGHVSIDTTRQYTKMIEQENRFADRLNLDDIFE